MKKNDKKFYETEEFKTLNRVWAKKLAKSGFVDIETEEYIVHNKVKEQNFSPDVLHLEYNQVCLDYLRSGVIVDKTDLFIFEKHCEGVSSRDIEILMLKEPNLRKLKFRMIAYRIEEILSEAGIDPIQTKN